MEFYEGVLQEALQAPAGQGEGAEAKKKCKQENKSGLGSSGGIFCKVRVHATQGRQGRGAAKANQGTDTTTTTNPTYKGMQGSGVIVREL